MSGNDTAYALADAYGGRDKTIAAMNAKAAQLGAWDTVAVDPSGLDAPGQHSSAYDLALLGRAVMQLPGIPAGGGDEDLHVPRRHRPRAARSSPAFEIQNHNQLLEKYAGTIGIKNGYTTGARNTFVGAVTRGGRTLLITQMGAIATPSWQRQAALLDWAFANAAQLRPVGHPRRPGRGSAARAGRRRRHPPPPVRRCPSATTKEPVPAASTSLPPVVAADQAGPGGNPGPWLLSSAVVRRPEPAGVAGGRRRGAAGRARAASLGPAADRTRRRRPGASARGTTAARRRRARLPRRPRAPLRRPHRLPARRGRAAGRPSGRRPPPPRSTAG